MSGNSSQEQRKRTVRQFLAAYPHSSRVLRDIDAAFSQFLALYPKQENFVGEDGRSHVVICLGGTLPIFYKGHSYNIPISLYIPIQYPHHCPVAIVTPTQNMVIKESQFVDAMGKFYHPYLTNWIQARDSCNLVDLLKIMQQIFSQDPPVYSKPSGSRTSSNSSPSPSSNYRHSQPQPTSNYSNVYHQQQQQQSQTPSASSSSSSKTNFTALPFSSSQPLSMPRPLLQHQYSVPSPMTTSPPPPTIPTRPTLYSTPESYEHQLKLSAYEERIRNILSIHRPILDSRIDKALEDNKKLLHAEVVINDRFNSLCKEKENVTAAIEALKSKLEQVASLEKKMKETERVKPEDVFMPPNIVSKQLMDAIATDHAIEDALYALGKLLQQGKIDSNIYLKNVRSLASEQFMKRALVKKIRSQMFH